MLLACLLFSAAAWAQENEGVWMRVVNCQEWVSLREKPDAASDCLAEVPLGAIVENCSVKNKAFTYAEYSGMSGYIMSQYLEIVPTEQALIGDLCIVSRGEWIPMRSGPFEAEQIIAWLAPGMRVEACVESIEGFAYGTANGMKGYVRLADLEAIPAALTP